MSEDIVWSIWKHIVNKTIDKAFLLGYNFTENGRFITWSPLQVIYDVELFDISLNLPLPSGKQIRISNSEELVNPEKGEYSLTLGGNIDELMNKLFLDYSYLNDINIESNYLNYKKDFKRIFDIADRYDINLSGNPSLDKDKLRLSLLIDILNRMNDPKINGIHISTTHANKKYFKEIIKNLNIHNLTPKSEGGYKNYSTFLMHKIMQDPRNATTAYKSIDIAIDAFKDPINKIKSNFMYNMDDGKSIQQMTAAGSTGKNGVGIAANGTKIYFTILNYTNRLLDSNEPLFVRELKESSLFNILRLDLEYKDFIENGNINEIIDPETKEVLNVHTNEDGRKYVIRHWKKNIGPIADAVITDNVKTLYQEALRDESAQKQFIINNNLDLYYTNNESTLNFIKRTNNYNKFLNDTLLYLFNDDASQSIGSFVSMTADNAKNLFMDKLKASTDVFSMHIFLAMIGCPPEIIVKFFNTNNAFNYILEGKTNNLTLGIMSDISSISFLKELNVLEEKINSFEKYSENEIIKFKILKELLLKLKYIFDCSKEISLGSNILSINQGVKVEENEIASLMQRLINGYSLMIEDRGVDPEAIYFNRDLNVANVIINSGHLNIDLVLDRMDRADKKLKAYNEKTKGIKPIGINSKFDLDLFLNDFEYQDVIISIVDVVKKHYNIYDVIAKVPHFNAMFKKYNDLIKGYISTSKLLKEEILDANYKYNPFLIVQENADPTNGIYGDDFKLPKKYNSSLVRYVKEAFNDTVLSNFLMEVVSQYKFKYNNVINIDNKIGTYKTLVSFLTENSLHNFIEFMNKIIIPKLCNIYPENNFLIGLQPNFIEYSTNNQTLFMFNENLKNLISDTYGGISKLQSIQKGFDEIKNIFIKDLMSDDQGFKFIGVKDSLTVEDFFYLYDLFSKKILPKYNDISNLMISYSPKSLITLHAFYVKDIDTNKRPFELSSPVIMAHVIKPLIKIKQGKKIIELKDKMPDGNTSILLSKYLNGKKVFSRILMEMPYYTGIDDEYKYEELLKKAIESGKLTISNDIKCN